MSSYTLGHTCPCVLGDTYMPVHVVGHTVPMRPLGFYPVPCVF